MGAVETTTSAKTLGEGSAAAIAAASPEQAKSRNPCSASRQGNGVKPSDDDAVEAVETRFVDKGTSALKESPGRKKIGGSGGLGDMEMKGVSSLLGMREGVRGIAIEDVRVGEGGKRSDPVLGYEQNGKKGVDQTEVGNTKSAVHDANNTALNIQVGESRNFGEKSRWEKNNDSLPDQKAAGMPMESTDGEESGKDDDVDDYGHEFVVGDFVWGKIKNHPWWPGVVYDPSDASDYAAKIKPGNRLLVAYFGDGTFSWCHPSQLKPFEENFEEVSKLSQSKNFVIALQDAVDIIGKLVELKLTCSCVPHKYRIGLDRPRASNTGIKEHVFVPDVGIHKFSFAQFEPRSFLASLRLIAQDVSAIGVLQLTVFKGILSSLYRARGGYQLISYHEPQPVTGLEDKVKDEVMGGIDLRHIWEIPQHGPFSDEWHSSPSQSLLHKCSASTEGRLQRRKQKSIAEIMERHKGVKAEDKEGRETMHATYPASSSGKEKRVKNSDGTEDEDEEDDEEEDDDDDEDDEDYDASLASMQRKKKKTLASRAWTTGIRSGEEKIRIVELDDRMERAGPVYEHTEEEHEDSPVTRKLKTKRDRKTADSSGKGLSPRERKRSKYLSPPYTSPILLLKRKDAEAESLKVSRDARVAERITRAAGILADGTLGIFKQGGEKVQKRHADESVMEFEKSVGSGQYKKRVIDPTKVKASPFEVLCDVRAVALDLVHPIKNRVIETVGEFLCYRLSEKEAGEDVQNTSDGGKDAASDALSVEQNEMGQKSSEKDDPEEKSSPFKGKGKAIGKPGKILQLHFVSKKLEKMMTMLERSSGKVNPDFKVELEGEMKALLEMVNAMATSSST